MSASGSAAAKAAGPLSALGAVTLWGVSFVATKDALGELSPITLVFVRFVLGTVVLLLIVRARRQRIVPPRDAWPMLAAMGFVGIFLHQMLQVHGLAMTTAVRTGWLIGLIPIWTALLAAGRGAERFGPRKVLGLVIGTAGALLVITRGRMSPELLALPTTRGDLLVLASTVSWAVYTNLGRRTLQRLGSGPATALSMAIGCVMLAPLFAAESGWTQLSRLSSRTVGAVLFLGIGCSGLGYLLWYAGLRRLGPSRVASFLYLEPLVTWGAAVGLLRETVAGTTILGGLLVLAGVMTVQRGE